MSGQELQRRASGATVGAASCSQRDVRRFRAHLAAMQRRGEIGAVWTDEAETARTGRFCVTYQRLYEPRPKMPLYATLTAAALGTLITVGVLAWHARYVILAAALAVLALWWAATRPSHAGLCPGLHCAGCRG